MPDQNECEVNLLAHAIDKRDMSLLTGLGLSPNYFEVYNELATRLFNKYEEDRRVPSRKMIKEKYPDVFLPESIEGDAPEYAEQLRNHHAKNRLKGSFEKVRKLYLSDEWQKILDDLPEELLEIKQITDNKRVDNLTARAVDRYDVFQKQSEGEQVYPTCFAHPDLNDYLGGLNGGDLVTITARSGVGKTWTSLLDSWASWNNGCAVLIVSFEMSATKLGFRFDSIATAKNGKPGFSNFSLSRGFAVRDSDLDVEQRASKATEESAEEYRQYIEGLMEGHKEGKLSSIYVVTPENAGAELTPDYIHSLAKSLNVDLVVVDYLMLVPHKGNKELRNALAEIAVSFKRSAQELDVPYIVPHQLNREAENAKEVSLANFAESDDIGRTVDIAINVEKVGNLVTYKLLKARGGPSEKKFAWTWDYDSGVRHVVPFADIVQETESKSQKFSEDDFSDTF